MSEFEWSASAPACLDESSARGSRLQLFLLFSGVSPPFRSGHWKPFRSIRPPVGSRRPSSSDVSRPRLGMRGRLARIHARNDHLDDFVGMGVFDVADAHYASVLHNDEAISDRKYVFQPVAYKDHRDAAFLQPENSFTHLGNCGGGKICGRLVHDYELDV